MADPMSPDRGSTVRARAARWVARTSSDRRTLDDDARRATWLADEPLNADIFADQMALWNAVGSLADDPLARAMLRGEPEVQSVRHRFGRRAAITALVGACAASLIVMTTGIGGGEGGEGGEFYATAPGEQRSVKLTDGSTVTLDTNSSVEARLTGKERRLVLQSGQAFFDVSKDAVRPFRVFVGKSEVRAIGTAFSVRKEGDGAQVFLKHGTISVGEPGETPVILRPGEQAKLAPAKIATVAKMDPDRAMAWRFGRLVFDATPLAAAVAEVNRYGGRQIMLSDSALGQIRISGVFHTREPDAFVETIVSIFPVRLAKNDTKTITLSPAS